MNVCEGFLPPLVLWAGLGFRVWGSAVAGSHFGLSGRCLNLFQLWLRGCPNCISELHIAV